MTTASSSSSCPNDPNEEGADGIGSFHTSSEAYLFAEESEAFKLISLLRPPPAAAPDASQQKSCQLLCSTREGEADYDEPDSPRDGASTSPCPRLGGHHEDAALARLRAIFDSYLECPTLLDRSLEALVTRLAGQARELIETMTAADSGDDDERDEERIEARERVRRHLSALYALSKVRGRKVVRRFLPHGVEDVEPVWGLLHSEVAALLAPHHGASILEGGEEDGALSPAPRWESACVLWNWIAALSLVPFDCAVMVLSREGLVSGLMSGARRCLEEAGPVREAAAACLASWAVRVDLERAELPSLVAWSIRVARQHEPGATSSTPESFRLLGVLQTLATILKQSSGDRQMLVRSLRPLWDIFLAISSGDDDAQNGNLLLRKLLIKWWTRMCCAVLPPPRVLAWRYHRGGRTLEESVGTVKPRQSQTGPEPSAGAVLESSDQGAQSIPDALDEAVLNQVEDGTGRLLESLGHSSTVVRWSAAKGIGRIAERLPPACADDVLDAVLELFDDPNRDNCWHGACLAVAEMARRGLLDRQDRLGGAVPRVVAAIQYDVPRGHKTVGAHVRDAACYAYWALARACSPDALKPYLQELSEAIVLTSLFDREVNCRRAASAAFQEAVGRQGAASFPNGIAILTCADYFSLGNRVEAYTSIARRVAQFEEYRAPIVRHLFEVKAAHWDPNIREVASKSLFPMTELDVQLVCDSALPYLLEAALDPMNLHRRHGAVLSVAEITLALAGNERGIESILSRRTLESLISLVPTIEKRRLYRGRGGEIMRAAVCRLVECLAFSKIPLTTQQQVQLLDAVDGSISHPSESIQKGACRSLEPLMARYFPVRETGPSARLQARVVGKFVEEVRGNDNPGATRGYALALGFLPAKLLSPTRAVLDEVLGCLTQAARFDALVGGESDAETRRNSLESMRRISLTVGLESVEKEASYPVFGLNLRQVQLLFDSYLLALKDYRSDKRGDVGCWCRMEAMEGFAVLTEMLSDAPDLTAVSSERIACMVGGMLKQLSEQLDAVRQKAGECFERVLKSPFGATSISRHAELRQALELAPYSGEIREQRSWGDPKRTFILAMKAACVGEDEYFSSVVAGMSVSVGGLTKSVSNAASAALVDWLEDVGDTEYAERLAFHLVRLLRQNRGTMRVSLPTIRTLKFLFARGFLGRLRPEGAAKYAEKFLDAFKETERSCDNVHRLHALADATVSLLDSADDATVQNAALAFLCQMLTHRFPRVRSYAAELLYVVLLDRIDASPLAIRVILETSWASNSEDLSLPSKELANGLGIDVEWSKLLQHSNYKVTVA